MSSQSEPYTTRDSSDIIKQKRDKLIYLEKKKPTLPYYLPQSFNYRYSFNAGFQFCNCDDVIPATPQINYSVSAQSPSRGSGENYLSSIILAWFPVLRVSKYQVFLVECSSMTGPCPMTGGQIISTYQSEFLDNTTLSYPYTPVAGTKRVFAFVFAYGRTRQSLPGIYSPEFSV
jgi:hypothetical protein